MEKGILYLVGVPIGSLEDISKRAIDTLKNVDYILSEDTRNTLILLRNFDIEKKLISYYKYVENKKLNKIIEDLEKGINIGLVTDAGLPCISDPGSILTKKAIEKGIKVISIPGPSAGILAFTASGFTNGKYIFYGFMEDVKKEIDIVLKMDFPVILYESPKRIKKLLEIIEEKDPNRYIVIGRELTKKFETYYYGKPRELINKIEEKGEFVVIIDKAEQIDLKGKEIPFSFHYKYYEMKGYENKEILKLISKDLGISKSEIYDKFIEIKKRETK